MKRNQFNMNARDEYYTPRYGVLPILPFIPRDKTVWCPFDTPRSEFVRVLKDKGIQCVHSHLCYGQDFYLYEPLKWDLIVSNPPFTTKEKILRRCIDLGKPFALLLPNTALNAPPIMKMVRQYDLRLLMPDHRIEFNKEGRVPFGTSFFCRDLLPEKMIVSPIVVNRMEISAMYDDPDLLIDAV